MPVDLYGGPTHKPCHLLFSGPTHRLCQVLFSWPMWAFTKAKVKLYMGFHVYTVYMLPNYVNPRLTPSQSPAQGSARLPAAHHGGQRCVQRRMAHPQQRPAPHVLHSTPHILSDCPLVSIFRSCILKDFSFHYLFWTVKGAEALATFLICSNSLLRPLPPRPDPP